MIGIMIGDNGIDLRTRADPEDILARGRALRERTPWATHDHHAAGGPGRPDVLEYLESSNTGRLAHMVPLRIGRMISSPFAFFRRRSRADGR